VREEDGRVRHDVAAGLDVELGADADLPAPLPVKGQDGLRVVIRGGRPDVLLVGYAEAAADVHELQVDELRDLRRQVHSCG